MNEILLKKKLKISFETIKKKIKEKVFNHQTRN